MADRWIIDSPSWPIRRRDDDLTTEQILDVLDLVGRQPEMPQPNAEPADEPKAIRCCPNHREPGEARYGCATAPGVTDPCCNDCHYWVAWNRYLDGDADAEPAEGDGWPKSQDCSIGAHRPCDRDYCRCTCHGQTTAEPAAPKAAVCNGNCIHHHGEVVIEDLCCPLHGADAEPAAS